MIYHSDIITPIVVGDTFDAYIKLIREDGKFDISLKPLGHRAVSGDQKLILDLLKKGGGFLPYTAKSDSDVIKREFKLSKKSFKKALGGLYKARKVELSDSGMKLLD
jgi:predicted RNA-binding protein (virulence factor B family)